MRILGRAHPSPSQSQSGLVSGFLDDKATGKHSGSTTANVCNENAAANLIKHHTGYEPSVALRPALNPHQRLLSHRIISHECFVDMADS